MTNKELKQAIKTALAENGYARGYSISVRDCGYSTAVKITVTDPAVNRAEVERIAKGFEEYERDIDGEILQGGNTYVIADYKSDIFDEVIQEWMETAIEAMQSKEELTRIFDGLYLLDLDHCGRLELIQQNEKGHFRSYVDCSPHLATMIYKFVTFGTIVA